MTAVEQALRSLDHQRDEMVAFLRALIATPSITVEMGERAIAEFVQAYTSRLGLPEPQVLAAREEHPNLIYQLGGATPGPALILCAHLDTQPVGDHSSWTCDPFEGRIDGDSLYGLGASDMKASVAALVYAATALVRAGALQQGSLILALVANEEDGGTYGADWLVRTQGLTADACVVCEPSGVLREWEAIYNAQRGQSAVWVRTLGQQMHSGVAHAFGATNAAVAMARVMEALDRDLRIVPADGPPTALAQSTVGVQVRCGDAWGICPGVADFGIDIRTLPGMHRDDVARGMDQALARLRRVHPTLEVSWQFNAAPLDWVAPTMVEAGSAVVSAAQAAAAEVLGTAPPLGVYPATTDASAFASVGGIPTIAALGPGRISLAHRADESVHLPSLFEAARMYVLVATQFLDQQRSR